MPASGSGSPEASRRMVAFSTPCAVGMVARRISSRRLEKREKSILPSCGLRFSAMSRSAMIFRRAMTAS